MDRATRPVLITDARRSPEQEVRGRELRYLAMMAVRVLCLVVAGVLVSYRVPLLWLWVPLCLVGMIVVPWLAVLLANDAPPKAARRGDPHVVPAAPAATAPAPVAGRKVIDVEP